MKAIRSKYRDKGFEIIGINVDNARKGAKTDEVQSMVRNVLIDFRASWPNILDGTGKNALTQAFGVTDIPANFLIDRDGKVIKVELSGAGLEKAIAEAVGTGEDAKAAEGRPRRSRKDSGG